MNRLAYQTGLAAFALASSATLAQAASPVMAVPEASADVPPKSAYHSRAISYGATPAVVTDADVGDGASFGRDLHWLGLSDMTVVLSDDCSSVDPGTACQTLAPAPAVTTFSFTDLNHIALPEKAANSLLCYWLSPLLTVSYNNPTATAVVASLNINPYLTVDNPLLATPGLIDPTTGLPFNGTLTTGMTSSQHFQVPLPAGLQIEERKRDSAVCIAGFLSRNALVETYGLSDAQSKDFFKYPMTVRLHLSGSSQYVDFATLYFGFRIIGD